MMTELFTKRSKQQQKRVFGYFKYIFNDHFVLALMFLLGALAFQYASWIQTLTPGSVPQRWVILWVLIISLLLLVGQLATFVDHADIVFLLPAEKHFEKYMRSAFRYSLRWPSAFLAGVLAVSWPFLSRVGEFSGLTFIGMLIALLSFKWAMLLTQTKTFEQSGDAWRYSRFALMVAHVLILWGTLNYQIWLYPICGVLIFGLTFLLVRRVKGSRTWQWERLIDQENRRQQQVDAVLSLFVDVPHRMMAVKRRKWVDHLLVNQQASRTPYPFLYSRTFWRQNFWLGLWVRLTLFTAVVTFFLPAHWLSLVIIALLILMNGMQLLPLMNSYDREPLLRIYPNTTSHKAKDGARWLGLPLSLTAIVTSIVAIWHYLATPGFIFPAILVTIATVVLYLWVYLPFRYRKKQ